jgi:hypothetical protein
VRRSGVDVQLDGDPGVAELDRRVEVLVGEAVDGPTAISVGGRPARSMARAAAA